MGFNLIHQASKGAKSVGHTISKPFNTAGHTIGKTFNKTTNSIDKGFSDAGNWVKGAGDTALSGVSYVGKSILGDLENLTSPTVLIVIGVVVVGVVILQATRR